MRIVAVQMSPGSDKAANIAQARRLVEEAVAESRPGLLGLPEMWTCLGGDRATKFAAAEPLPPPGSDSTGGEAYETLRALARQHRMHLHGGSLAEREGERLFNTSLVFDPDGREVARYRKIHLFDITTPDGTGYRESATYGGGGAVVTCDVGGIRLGLSICYDLRFPELFLALRRRGAELILVPSAFTLQTGKDHWEPLLRARAIETQCWIMAAATFGRFTEPKGERHTYGHSLICDPWGQVVSMASDGTGHAAARFDRELLRRVRAGMPVLEHRDARIAPLPGGTDAAG